MGFKHIPFGTAERFNVVIEIPKGSQNKYEHDEELDVMKLDWVFTGDFKFIFDYGFVPQTRGGDGDMLDAFVLTSHSLTQGVVVECRAIGMIELLDRGEVDDKILAVPIADRNYEKVRELSELDFDYEQTFRDFFKKLGVQKDKVYEIKGFKGSNEAKRELTKAHERFAK